MMMITEVSRSEHSELCTTAVAGTPGWESRAACSDATGEVTKLFFSDELPDIALRQDRKSTPGEIGRAHV